MFPLSALKAHWLSERMSFDKFGKWLRRILVRIYPVMDRREILFPFLKIVTIFASFTSDGNSFFSHIWRRKRKILVLKGNSSCLISSRGVFAGHTCHTWYCGVRQRKSNMTVESQLRRVEKFSFYLARISWVLVNLMMLSATFKMDDPQIYTLWEIYHKHSLYTYLFPDSIISG